MVKGCKDAKKKKKKSRGASVKSRSGVIFT